MATLDERVASLVKAIEEVDPDWDETLLIVTAYHGGDGTGHDPYLDQSLYERRIPELLFVPWIAFGAGVRSGTRLDDRTASGQSGRYVNIMDTAPTVLYALGIMPPPDWHCRGMVVHEAFESPTTTTTTTTTTTMPATAWAGFVLSLLVVLAVGVASGLRMGRKHATTYATLPTGSLDEKERMVGPCE